MAAKRGSGRAMIEALETRELFTAILHPSAVEGTYTGSDNLGQNLELTISATSESITTVGVGSVSMALSSKAFKKLREGSFGLDGKVGKVIIDLAGKVTDKGLKISGTYKAIGKTTLTGTFSLTKI